MDAPVSKQIDYPALMHRALRRVMADVLEDVAVDGLPGNHHFFISFETQHPDVDMPSWLKEQHPENITIVIQNWFEDLAVSDTWFEITLSFSNQPVRLHVPFDAVLTFVDPSVEFGLRFDAPDESDDDALDETIEAIEDEAPQAAPETKSDGKSEVVSLDAFRK